MHPRCLDGLTFALTLALCACSADAGQRLRVGSEGPRPPTGGHGGGAGSSGAPAPSRDGGVGVAWEALSVHVEDVADMTIEIVTVRCAGDCADIEAVAHGGNPPYSFEWEGGSTAATRHVCLDADATLSVTATDTAVRGDEFTYDAQTATSHVTATVLGCQDAGAPTLEGPCIANPSFEGTAQVNPAITFDAAPWRADCVYGGAEVAGPSAAFPGYPAASAGATYAAGGGSFGGSNNEVVVQHLCEPLRAGQRYSFRIDLACLPAPSYSPGQLIVRGTEADCSLDEVYWTSPPLTGAWKTHCVTIEPTLDTTHLMLEPSSQAPGALAVVLIDNIVPVAACP